MKRLLASLVFFGAWRLVFQQHGLWLPNLFVAGWPQYGSLRHDLRIHARTEARSTFASGLDGPNGLAFDSSGDLFGAD